MTAVHVAAWLGAALAIAGLVLEVFNLRFFPVVPPDEQQRGTVVACIAARNEADTIEACLDALLAEPQISQIIVCDDGSVDTTVRIVRARTALGQRVTVLESGGTGKSAALEAAASLARSYTPEELLFVDADTRIAAGAVGGLLQYQRSRRAHAVSIWPMTDAHSPWDRLFAHAVVLLLLQALPMGRAERSGDPRFAAGNGQLFLVDSDAYLASGGHAGMHGVVEDVALARRLKSAGYRIALGSGAALASTDGYGSLGNNVRGYGRSLLHGSGRAGCLIFSFWQLFAFALPWVLVCFDALPALLALAASASAHAIVSNRMRGGRLGAVAGWLIAGWLLAGSAAYVALRTGPTVWKDRKLAL